MEKDPDESMEDEVMKLKAELLSSKLEIVRLQQLVKKNEREINALKNAEALPACPEGKDFKCVCKLSQEKVEAIEDKIKVLEKKVKMKETTAFEETDASVRRPKISSRDDSAQTPSLQSQFCAFQQKAQEFQTKAAAAEQVQRKLIATVDEKVQRLETKFSDIHNEMIQGQAQAYFVPQTQEETKRYEEFLKHQEIVKNHLFPLSYEEYIKLGTLETIICAKDRVAVKIKELQNFYSRDFFLNEKCLFEKEAERYRRQGCTPLKAMIRYVRMTQGSTNFPEGTKFFLVILQEEWAWHIIVISGARLICLDANTKKEMALKRYPLQGQVEEMPSSLCKDFIQECRLSDHHVWQLTMTFKDNSATILLTREDKELHACILNMLRSF